MPHDKRDRIIRAAERLFSSRRYHEVTLEEVARAAKVGKGTIYLHFKDKDDLFIATASAGFDQMTADIRKSISEDADCEDKLRAISRPIDRFFENRRWIRDVIHDLRGGDPGFRRRLHEERRQHLRQLDDLLGPVFGEAAAGGWIRQDIPPRALARLFFDFVGAHARAFEEEAESAPSLDALVDVFLSGVFRPGTVTPDNPLETRCEEL